MPKLPEIALLDEEKQWVNSELLPGQRVPYSISEGVPRHPVEETNFSHLYLVSCSFGHDLKFHTMGESKNVD